MDGDPQEVVDEGPIGNRPIGRVDRLAVAENGPVVVEACEGPGWMVEAQQEGLNRRVHDEEDEQDRRWDEEDDAQVRLERRREGALGALPFRTHGGIAAWMFVNTALRFDGLAHNACNWVQNVPWNVPPIVSSRSDRMTFPVRFSAMRRSTTG